MNQISASFLSYYSNIFYATVLLYSCPMEPMLAIWPNLVFSDKSDFLTMHDNHYVAATHYHYAISQNVMLQPFIPILLQH